MSFSSRWADAWKTCSAAIDDRFGELFLYTPMNGSARPPVQDATRAVKVITGALDEKRAYTYPESRHKAESTVPQQATHDSTIDIAINALPYRPQSGDVLQQCNQDGVPNGATFKVDSPDDDGFARIVLRVVKMRSSVPASP